MCFNDDEEENHSEMHIKKLFETGLCVDYKVVKKHFMLAAGCRYTSYQVSL